MFLCQSGASSSSPCLFLSISPSCSAGDLCIRQALCGKQWDYSFVIVIIFISASFSPCLRPPGFFFSFFFLLLLMLLASQGSQRVSLARQIVMATTYLAICCSPRRCSNTSESYLLDVYVCLHVNVL